jgi:hypothetical protein
VEQFRNSLDKRPLSDDPLVQKMAEQIDHYDTRFFPVPSRLPPQMAAAS